MLLLEDSVTRGQRLHREWLAGLSPERRAAVERRWKRQERADARKHALWGAAFRLMGLRRDRRDGSLYTEAEIDEARFTLEKFAIEKLGLKGFDRENVYGFKKAKAKKERRAL